MVCWKNSQSLLQILFKYFTFSGSPQLPAFLEFENPCSILKTKGRDDPEGPEKKQAFPWGS